MAPVLLTFLLYAAPLSAQPLENLLSEAANERPEKRIGAIYALEHLGPSV